MKFQFIETHRNEFPIVRMCSVLEVSRGGYFAWRRRPSSRRDQENERLLIKIKAIHQQSRETYGSPRVFAALQQDGETCGLNRIARLMNQNQIQGKKKRPYYPSTTDSNHDYRIAENTLNREFTVETLNTVWLTDITYIHTDEGWLYLSAVMDLCSRQIVGWSMADHLRTELTLSALDMAINQRQVEVGLIHHSDRGTQYASDAYQLKLKEHEMICSMSRKGNCWDNAPMESFFDTLKSDVECSFKTHEDARMVLFEYIECFYNRERLHSSIGYLSPVNYETQLAA